MFFAPFADLVHQPPNVVWQDKYPFAVDYQGGFIVTGLETQMEK